MANNKKNASRNTQNNHNNATSTRPYFVIANVEGDIRRKGKSTQEICEKYGKTPEEVMELISKAYHGSEGRVRELMRSLEKNDENYEKRRASRVRREQPETVIQEASKTPQEIQQEKVNEAQKDLTQKTEEMAAAEKAMQNATANRAKAQENLNKAKEELTRADDALMMAESKKRTATVNLTESRARYDEEVKKLQEMTKPVLLHISAVEEGIPCGKVYMSAYDYAKLSTADKDKVIPVDTSDSTIEVYPDGFYEYPTKLGMDGYQSACQYALAYVKLFLDGVDGIELRCADEVIKNFAYIQSRKV